MRVRVIAFARLRELAGFSERSFDLSPGARIEDVWIAALADVADARALRASTRFARNGAVARFDDALHDGDEVALLPPVGGG
jgi:molybdopterin synthase sulfur carrier subunit